MAMDWARRKCQPTPAMITFKIPRATLYKPGVKSVNLDNNHALLVNVVLHNRKGRKTPSLQMERLYKDIDFIEGPICYAWSRKPLSFDFSKRQLCVISEEMAEQFGDPRNIHSAIFF